MSADTGRLIALARGATPTGELRTLTLELANALEAAEAQLAERITKETGLAIIADANRWQDAYDRMCEEKAAVEAQRDTLAVEHAAYVLVLLDRLAESNWCKQPLTPRSDDAPQGLVEGSGWVP